MKEKLLAGIPAVLLIFLIAYLLFTGISKTLKPLEAILNG